MQKENSNFSKMQKKFYDKCNNNSNFNNPSFIIKRDTNKISYNKIKEDENEDGVELAEQALKDSMPNNYALKQENVISYAISPRQKVFLIKNNLENFQIKKKKPSIKDEEYETKIKEKMSYYYLNMLAYKLKKI